MNDDFLTKFRKEPRTEFASALYQRINKPMQTQSKRPALRFAALSLSLLAVLTAAFLFSPSVRAFAQAVIRQVGGYAFVLGGQPIDTNGVTGPIRIVKTLGSVSIETIGKVPSANDPAGASTMAGFTVLAPSYLPAGFTSMSGWFVSSEDNSMVVTNGYRDSTNHFLIVNQWNVSSGAVRTYAKDQIVDVTVRGHPGVWLPDAVNGPAGKNALVWEEKGITYSLITDSVPLDELLKLAESLSK
jgi:hypothetical protein